MSTTLPPPLPGSSKFRYLRLKRFDIDSAGGRAAERYRLAAWGALVNFVSRLAGMLLVVVTVHWASPYLGPERFGVWATFASLAAMLSFLDLGVGNALINRVAHAASAANPTGLRTVVTGGVGWLALIGLATALLLTSAAVVVPWGTLFKVSSVAIDREARDAGLVFGGLFGLNLLSSGLLKILVGQQRSHEGHLISAAFALLACGTLWWATEQRASVAGLLLAGFGTQAVAGLVVLPLLWRRGLLHLDRLLASMRDERNSLLRTGSVFLALQIGTMIGWGSDSLMLASLRGASEVAAFAIAQRLFQFASQPFAVLNAPLWAAYADARARGDHGFLRHTLKRSALLSVSGGAILALALLASGPWAISHWTQGAVSVHWSLLSIMAAWTVIEVGSTVFGTYLNGAGIVREQLIVVLVFCAVALPLKAFATTQAGAQGLVAATILAYLATVVGLYATVFRRRVLEPLRQPIG